MYTLDETQCSYQYTSQPGKANCYPEAPLPLELRCQVTGNTNNYFTIQWHYSNSSSPPLQYNNSSVENVIHNDSEAVLEIREDKLGSIAVVSKLTLDYNLAAGYYWCTVMNASDSTPNPSKVLNISTCPFNGDTPASTNLAKCNPNISLFETPMIITCADHNVSIDIENVQFGSTEMCADVDKDPDTKETTMHGSEPSPTMNSYTSDIKETIMHGSEPSPTMNSYTSEERITADRTSPILDVSTISPSSGFPMHIIWMIVGIAFALLIAIIIVMLIAIVYLNHKKNKIRGTAYYT